MNCKYCGQELPAGTHGKREYCNDAHRQAFFRRQHQQDQAQGRTFTEMLSELTELRAKARDQAQTIEEQAGQISRLLERLDIEKRYLADTKQHGFKTFLKSQPETPLTAKLLADQFFMPRDTRAHYEYRLHRLHCTEEELQEFTRLWKLMLLSKP